jgi:predicted translin family RNA/ssDNA-binding protein
MIFPASRILISTLLLSSRRIPLHSGKSSKNLFAIMSTSAVQHKLPALPNSITTEFGRTLKQSISLTFGPIQEEISSNDEVRDAIYRETKSVLKNNAQIFVLIRTGETSLLNELISANEIVLKKLVENLDGDLTHREGRLAQSIEKFAESRLLQHFFATGTLASLNAIQPCSDDEYIGAIFGFAQELARYVVGRASDGDKSSVAICRTLVAQLNGKMLEFDFRNGPLRKKYDGLKYALKSIEDIIYEMSLLDDTLPAISVGSNKKQRTEGSDDVSMAVVVEAEIEASLVDNEAIDGIRERMETYDKLREDVIKQSRDIQKLSKQAIYSVHRGALQDSRTKLDQAMVLANKIFETVNVHTNLRHGAFSNSLEEWAEGALTLAWVEKKCILTREDMQVINSHEYIGALSDFTGDYI